MDIEQLLKEIFAKLQEILDEINDEAVEKTQKKEALDLPKFFSTVRGELFDGRLTKAQVSGMEAKIKAFQEAGFPLSWSAYALATSFHETARRMQPVREGLNASEKWRQKHLRYYPYYGRGDVQLTWLANYQRADSELGLNGELVRNLDLALDPDVSAKVMVRGMKEGWFTRKKMIDYLPDDTGRFNQFQQARRIINGMDKADLIAGYAMKFQAALKEAGYGSTDSR